MFVLSSCSASSIFSAWIRSGTRLNLVSKLAIMWACFLATLPSSFMAWAGFMQYETASY